MHRAGCSIGVILICVCFAKIKALECGYENAVHLHVHNAFTLCCAARGYCLLKLITNTTQILYKCQN